MNSKIIIRYMFIPAIALLLTLKIFGWVNNILSKNLDAKHEVASVSKATIGDDFTLVNQEGQKFSYADLKGKLKLVYFGFTSCPEICPIDLKLITDVMKDLGEDAKKVQPIFITIDPERDNPAKLKEFLSNFYSGIIGLTGTKEQIEEIEGKYHVYSKKVETATEKDNKKEAHAEYTMDHSSYIYLMGKDGEYITHFNDKQDVKEISTKIKNNF